MIVAELYPPRIGSTEYDEWPRGRIVHETPARHFVLYADSRPPKPGITKGIKGAFGPNEAEVVVRGDVHFR